MPDDKDTREELAKAIFEFMRFDEHGRVVGPEWVDGGNSVMQDRARKYASLGFDAGYFSANRDNQKHSDWSAESPALTRRHAAIATLEANRALKRGINLGICAEKRLPFASEELDAAIRVAEAEITEAVGVLLRGSNG